MITLITEKLQGQTLEEISATKTIPAIQARNCRSNNDAVGRSSKLYHRRTMSNKASTNLTSDVTKPQPSSFLTTRCHSYPPARKRLCRSLSDTQKDNDCSSNWNPEPSSIWTPVKSKQNVNDYTNTSGARSLEFGNKETFSWSTPPESPNPRPSSANSSLEESKFFPLLLISEEKDKNQWDKVLNYVGDASPKMAATMPRRSHSHPSFSLTTNNCTLKRRLSEIDIPRPALDFNKMKARAFPTKNYDKRSLKSSRYAGKRNCSSKEDSTVTQGKLMLTTSVPEDLGVSLLITPTASPTVDMTTVEEVQLLNNNIANEDANRKSSTVYYIQCNNPIIMNEELDIELIEEDGAFIDPKY